MKIFKIFLLLFLSVSFASLSAQQDSTTIKNEYEGSFKPSFFGFQIEATSLLFINELGASVDFNLYSTENRKYNFGTRFSTEYYKLLNISLGGGGNGDTECLDFSVYGNYSIRGESFWFSPLLGLSLHSSWNDNSSDSKILVKWGFDLRYNIYRDNIGLIFKLALPILSKNNTHGFVGIGLVIGFYN